MKNYNANEARPCAFIVDSKDRGRKKIYLNSKIYLDNDQEFLIELFNPTKDSVLAEIKVNGNKASGNGLILRPGERFYLDCFVSDKRKFIFKTYEVENSIEAINAISNNGFVEVSFFKERISSKYKNCGLDTFRVTDYLYDGLITNQININGLTNGVTVPNNTTVLRTSIVSPINAYCASNITDTIHCSDYVVEKLDVNSIMNEYIKENLEFNKSLNSVSNTETGRVEKGAKSQQKFEAVDMEFETYCLNKVFYQLLPNSKKPIETTELKKNFCGFCGTKNKDYKFCPNCGEKI